MGCLNGSQEGYFKYSKSDEEKNFRQWEQSLGFLRNNFGSVIALVLNDARQIRTDETLKVILNRNFSPKFTDMLFSNEFFVKEVDGKKVINANKLRYLIFISTIHVCQTSFSKVYTDKAALLFGMINCDEEDESCAPIERTNTTLTKIISYMFEIAAIELSKSYLKSPYGGSGGRDQLYKKFADNKDDIVEYIIIDMFTQKGVLLEQLGFNETNSIFLKNPNVIF